jgi:hypothetical protein
MTDIGNLAWIADLGIPGLLVIAGVALVFIFGKWILPGLKDVNLRLNETLQENHAETMRTVAGLSAKVDKLIESDADQEKRLRSIEMTQMKKDVYNNNIPYVERVWSAHKYIRIGGNGGVKDYILGEFRNQDKNTFDAAWKLADNATGIVPIDLK